MADPTVIGNQAPLVSKNTVNAGVQYRQPLGDDLNGTIRVDYQEIGRTWWEPYNITSRNPVSLVDLRMGVQAQRWTVTAWSKNLTNKIYNAEFSPGNVGGSGFPVEGLAAALWSRSRLPILIQEVNHECIDQTAVSAASHGLRHA
jgi:outer membrane receptor protein involved in Fe transport